MTADAAPQNYLVTTVRQTTDKRLITAPNYAEAAVHAFHQRGHLVQLDDDGAQVTGVEYAEHPVRTRVTSHHTIEGLLVLAVMAFLLFAGLLGGVVFSEEILAFLRLA